MGNKNVKKKGSLVLTEEEISSLMANTSFSREEILQWHDGFVVSLFGTSRMQTIDSNHWFCPFQKDCPKGRLGKVALKAFGLDCQSDASYFSGF